MANWIQKTHMNKGGLHRATGTPMGKNIPKAKVERAAHSSSPHMAHMGQAALNMEGLPHIGNIANARMGMK
jgi:hypothetical protein